MELLNAVAIRAAMNDAALRYLATLEVVPTIDSTNRYLMEKTNAASGTVCFAEQQSAGRGRRGKTWLSPAGGNLYFSLLWQFPPLHDIAGLSLIIGIALAKALRNYGIENVKLKWPNDVWYFYQKLAGILVEISGDKNSGYRTVIGVGLNINMPKLAKDEIDQPWIDLQRITSMTVSRNQLAGLLLQELFIHLPQFTECGLAAFLNDWQQFDALAGQEIIIHSPAGTMAGIAVGLDDQGRLLAQCGNIQHCFNSGEVTIRRCK